VASVGQSIPGFEEEQETTIPSYSFTVGKKQGGKDKYCP